MSNEQTLDQELFDDCIDDISELPVKDSLEISFERDAFIDTDDEVTEGPEEENESLPDVKFPAPKEKEVLKRLDPLKEQMKWCEDTVTNLDDAELSDLMERIQESVWAFTHCHKVVTNEKYRRMGGYKYEEPKEQKEESSETTVEK